MPSEGSLRRLPRAAEPTERRGERAADAREPCGRERHRGDGEKGGGALRVVVEVARHKPASVVVEAQPQAEDGGDEQVGDREPTGLPLPGAGGEANGDERRQRDLGEAAEVPDAQNVNDRLRGGLGELPDKVNQGGEGVQAGSEHPGQRNAKKDRELHGSHVTCARRLSAPLKQAWNPAEHEIGKQDENAREDRVGVRERKTSGGGKERGQHAPANGPLRPRRKQEKEKRRDGGHEAERRKVGEGSVHGEHAQREGGTGEAGERSGEPGEPDTLERCREEAEHAERKRNDSEGNVHGVLRHDGRGPGGEPREGDHNVPSVGVGPGVEEGNLCGGERLRVGARLKRREAPSVHHARDHAEVRHVVIKLDEGVNAVGRANEHLVDCGKGNDYIESGKREVDGAQVPPSLSSPLCCHAECKRCHGERKGEAEQGSRTVQAKEPKRDPRDSEDAHRHGCRACQARKGLHPKAVEHDAARNLEQQGANNKGHEVGEHGGSKGRCRLFSTSIPMRRGRAVVPPRAVGLRECCLPTER